MKKYSELLTYSIIYILVTHKDTIIKIMVIILAAGVNGFVVCLDLNLIFS